MNPEMTPVIFTPDNEPYLGREFLFHFDQLICSAMEENAVTRNLSMKMRHLQQQFSVAPDRYLVAPVC